MICCCFIPQARNKRSAFFVIGDMFKVRVQGLSVTNLISRNYVIRLWGLFQSASGINSDANIVTCRKEGFVVTLFHKQEISSQHCTARSIDTATLMACVVLLHVSYRKEVSAISSNVKD